MTTPGPNHFFSCPNCKTVLRRRTIASGNTFGSTLWSDSYLDAPMRPTAVQATRCPSCSKVFFVDDAEDLGNWKSLTLLGQREPQLPIGYENAPFVVEADLNALAELLDQTDDPKRVWYLRLQTWHLYNHARRKEGAQVELENQARFDENLERLIDLLKDDRGNDQIMKSEALRELGRFEQAVSALQDIDAELSWVSEQIRSMALAASSTVSVLLRPGEERPT